MVTAIVVAAGSGRRMARAVNKVFLLLGGRPVLLHSVEALAACRREVRPAMSPSSIRVAVVGTR